MPTCLSSGKLCLLLAFLALCSSTNVFSRCDPQIQSCVIYFPVTTSTSSSSSSSSSSKPLNVLLLYGDDWRHDSLGVASRGAVKTPFLDSLAKEGVRFTHNCVTSAVCWVSRASLYTGQWMSRHKSTSPSKPIFYNHWNNSFVRLLQSQGGYHVGHVGKWHFDRYDEIEKTWDFSREYHGQHWYRVGKSRSINSRMHVTKRNERDALKFLKQRPKDKPFYLEVCFFAPHAVDQSKEQYFPQPRSMQLYVNATISKSVSATDEAWKKMPRLVFTEENLGRVRYHWRYDTDEKYQSMMKNYYRLITEVDQVSKRIVKELENQGILNETLVIFTTDNGLFHAEHGLADKWYPHQESIRVPLIIKDPRMDRASRGRTMDQFTLSVDLASTILRAANLSPDPRMQGRDIAELYLGSSFDWRNEFFYEHPRYISEKLIPANTALVRKDWKYIRFPAFSTEQLFDLRSDPYELNDLLEVYRNSTFLADIRFRHDELKALAV